MLGGHFDSWHSGTGATDNAAGSTVMIEAIRILKAIDFKPKRTIQDCIMEFRGARICLDQEVM
jgi:carboxypeptidase Q